jgi:hypothetical protein
MRIKTVVSHPFNGVTYVSPHDWNDPTYALAYGGRTSGFRIATPEEEDQLRKADCLPLWPGENHQEVDIEMEY